MRRLFFIATVTSLLTGCAGGCGPLGWNDDVRDERGGTPPDDDVVSIDLHDGGGSSQPDAHRGGASDAGDPLDEGLDVARETTDVGNTDATNDIWTPVCGDGNVQATEACDDGNTSDGDYCAADCSATTGSCGDGTLQQNETCDDGLTVDCTTTRDGGDGTCVAAGTCSEGYVDDGTDCVPELITEHVHIYVANDCTMMVDPPEYTVPAGQKVRFSWHNHSQDYPVDVWQSYIGGFTDLPTGATWDEQFEWCANVNAYTGYSDITTNEACPSHRFLIHCNGQ